MKEISWPRTHADRHRGFVLPTPVKLKIFHRAGLAEQKSGHDLAKAISRATGIPFVPAFSPKTDKLHHGRHAGLNQSKSVLLESSGIRNRSILFVDDCITSGTTARLCYETLVALGNHVDVLIWVSAGG